MSGFEFNSQHELYLVHTLIDDKIVALQKETMGPEYHVCDAGCDGSFERSRLLLVELRMLGARIEDYDTQCYYDANGADDGS